MWPVDEMKKCKMAHAAGYRNQDLFITRKQRFHWFKPPEYYINITGKNVKSHNRLALNYFSV
jgi:hypothetical protein